jgi:hypothetical protein
VPLLSPRPLFLVLLALLSACATPSSRITAKLTEFGVPPGQARCMGNGLQDRLSIPQLQRLVEIVELKRDRVGRMTVADIVATLSQSGDTELVVEVLRTGLKCAI